MRKIVMVLALAMATTQLWARWSNEALKMPAEWYGSPQAREVAQNVLFYQRAEGGWPKNIEMKEPITQSVRKAVDDPQSSLYLPTLDNGATTTEVRFLAMIYATTPLDEYKEAFVKGLKYILEAQYPNGGWPEYYPLRKGYYTHITYNDDAIYNIMVILLDICNNKPLYSALVDKELRDMVCKSFNRGVESILATQIVRNGKPTVWCAQHDENTLQPAAARAYELASFSGQESVGLAMLLMKIANPSPAVIRAIEGAVEWFQGHAIKGFKLTSEIDAEGRKNAILSPEQGAPLLWARFYDLESEEPFFCDRDGVKKSDMSQIGHERRNGYGWYTTTPQKLLNSYPKWREKWVK